MSDISKCPVMGHLAPQNRHTAAAAMNNGDWWPNQLNLNILRQNSSKSDPLNPGFNYAEEFKKLDLEALRKWKWLPSSPWWYSPSPWPGKVGATTRTRPPSCGHSAPR